MQAGAANLQVMLSGQSAPPHIAVHNDKFCTITPWKRINSQCGEVREAEAHLPGHAEEPGRVVADRGAQALGEMVLQHVQHVHRHLRAPAVNTRGQEPAQGEAPGTQHVHRHLRPAMTHAAMNIRRPGVQRSTLLLARVTMMPYSCVQRAIELAAAHKLACLRNDGQ